ncbi:hypothetical protein IR083_07645 [Dysgonomonas sp. GY75]|uniref:hypothetical protein n=1 Tax=Dysgonomonas sp. GY75 TaxID=2780419 RepID=UPI0018832F25|nr:hypothetical protein [Dysgonomonas sp. GY75]MBF0648690.1 hypothetical protein [Dysgonomonas sp. GY75]
MKSIPERGIIGILCYETALYMVCKRPISSDCPHWIIQSAGKPLLHFVLLAVKLQNGACESIKSKNSGHADG